MRRNGAARAPRATGGGRRRPSTEGSRQFGLVGGDSGGQVGVAARLVDCASQHCSQTPPPRRNDEEGMAKVGDLDLAALTEVPPSPGLGGQGHLATIGHLELCDWHGEPYM